MFENYKDCLFNDKIIKIATRIEKGTQSGSKSGQTD